MNNSEQILFMNVKNEVLEFSSSSGEVSDVTWSSLHLTSLWSFYVLT